MCFNVCFFKQQQQQQHQQQTRGFPPVQNPVQFPLKRRSSVYKCAACCVFMKVETGRKKSKGLGSLRWHCGCLCNFVPLNEDDGFGFVRLFLAPLFSSQIACSTRGFSILTPRIFYFCEAPGFEDIYMGKIKGHGATEIAR